MRKTKKLKVYGWIDLVPAKGRRSQARAIAAVSSKVAAARLAGFERADQLFCLCETGNDEEVRIAMAHPNRVIYCGLDERGEDRWWFLKTCKKVCG